MSRGLCFAVAAIVAGVSPLTACSTGGDGEAAVTVSAASSLTEAFDEIAAAFEADHPLASVQLTYDKSSSLAEQIEGGASADVFASADEANMQRLVEGETVDGDPTVFATNELVIVTKPGNPLGVTALSDLADVDVVAMCDESAPCGKYAAEVLANAGTEIAGDHVTRGENAKATVTAVAEGDADAGIVYASDLQAAGDALEGVGIPAPVNVTASYPIAVLAPADGAASDGDAAQDFVDYVLSDQGQAVLASYGFGPPP